MTTVSTHVLDTSTGLPAAGMHVTASGPGGQLGEGVTDDDGRLRPLVDDAAAAALGDGPLTVRFATGPWAAERGRESFFPEVVLVLDPAGAEHLHVPLLLSPFAYSTYRGS
ncbi:hydroxyisourate hydrolase [Pseudokineococcus sp. 1T1Z-3]|uniref:hydroxyisourate hydrolase n=1 Tax=Pseudokineococcus sp. 1T1Z-3 TaxID=3132745 RepID=UPI0030A3CFDF